MAFFMKRISTHVLDIAHGRPAKDVAVRLERREITGDWIALASARTDADGRCGQLLPSEDALRAGLYRLSFDAASYHHAQKVEGLYPVVEITFQVHEGESQFHIPLLLSPHGYTTYRGS
jgi:5-hydroxyisourate hydrolase